MIIPLHLSLSLISDDPKKLGFEAVKQLLEKPPHGANRLMLTK